MLRSFRARRLSRIGEHTPALALSAYSDNEVLSRAGMHLTLLEGGDDGSIFVGTAYAHTGDVDRAMGIALRHISAFAVVRPLLGQLAAAAPEATLALLEARPEFDDLAHYCRIMVGDGGAAALSRDFPPLLACASALRGGQADAAQTAFERVFADAFLPAPTMDWSQMTMALHTIRHEQTLPPAAAGPLISVVLTAFNEQECLPLAVNSLLRQTWKNLELIIVNDASTDATSAMAHAFAKEDDRVRVVDLESNVGLWRAKNIGFQHCRGDFITMHDADDWSHAQKLERQIAPLLGNLALQATTSNFFRIDQGTGLPYTRNACNYQRWNPSSLLFRRQVLDEIGNFLDRLLGSDGEFIARLETRYGAQNHFRLRQPLSIGYQRPASLSNRFRGDGDDGRVTRLLHWESWRKAHVENFKNQLPSRYVDTSLDAVLTSGAPSAR